MVGGRGGRGEGGGSIGGGGREGKEKGKGAYYPLVSPHALSPVDLLILVLVREEGRGKGGMRREGKRKKGREKEKGREGKEEGEGWNRR